MASPQKENGYTPVANELLEALCRTRIPGEARQVFDVIIRLTYGYNKKTAEISIATLQRATSLNRPNVCRALKLLLLRNLIVKNMDKYVTNYGIQKNYKMWAVTSVKNDTTKTSIKNETGGSLKNDTKLVSVSCVVASLKSDTTINTINTINTGENLALASTENPKNNTLKTGDQNMQNQTQNPQPEKWDIEELREEIKNRQQLGYRLSEILRAFRSRGIPETIITQLFK